MRMLYVRDRSGRITAWGCNDAGQGVYYRALGNSRFAERRAPSETPVFSSRWHFLRWISRHFGVRGIVVDHTGWHSPAGGGTCGTPLAAEEGKCDPKLLK